jgi:hypothetical protein
MQVVRGDGLPVSARLEARAGTCRSPLDPSRNTPCGSAVCPCGKGSTPHLLAERSVA